MIVPGCEHKGVKLLRFKCSFSSNSKGKQALEVFNASSHGTKMARCADAPGHAERSQMKSASQSGAGTR